MTGGKLYDFFERHEGTLRILGRLGFAISILTVCVLSLLPGQNLPRLLLSDKISHLIAYTEITALGLLVFPGRRQTAAVIAAVIALGGVLEVAQHFVPNRSTDLLDFAVNCVGVLLGVAVARLVMRLRPAKPVRAR